MGFLNTSISKRKFYVLVYKTLAAISGARLCTFDRSKADIYANVRINNLTWKFGHEEKNRYVCVTGCSFYRVCHYSKCHGTCRRMQAIYCLKQPCWGGGQD